ILFIVCCAFYLAWWLVAFNPSGTSNAAKTGWLLIPATIAGLAGVILIIRGILVEKLANQLLGGGFILWGGIAVYFILLAITVFLFKRPATTELILIVGWGMLMLAEINTLYGIGLFPRGLSIGFLLFTCVAVVISLVCYVLYYRLDNRAGYIDGMIPLLLSALTIAGVSGCILFR
ncbi:MAG: hypothetical protein FWF26_03065, partial [Treponema sp.]|nr:hypothetical protein [Treponema sp.]